MRYSILLSVLMMLITLSASSQRLKVSKAHEIPTVAFCDLLSHPEAYREKVIRTRAIFTRGGEDWVAIYSPTCSTDKNLVRPEYDDAFDQNTPSKIRRQFEHYEITLEATLIGTFDDKYFRFHLLRAEQAVIISKRASSPWRLPDKLKARTISE